MNQTSVFLFGCIGVALLYRNNSIELLPKHRLWVIKKYSFLFLLFLSFKTIAQNTSTKLWHDKERTIHYQPQGNDFILYKGTRKFNRALYGTNTGFRVEAGDLPEFALYMPGMGGNCKIGISVNGKSKWLSTADQIKTLYRPGTMLFEIKDSLLGNGVINISVLAMADAEGMFVKLETVNIAANTSLVIVYGGATGKNSVAMVILVPIPNLLFIYNRSIAKTTVIKLRKIIFDYSMAYQNH